MTFTELAIAIGLGYALGFALTAPIRVIEERVTVYFLKRAIPKCELCNQEAIGRFTSVDSQGVSRSIRLCDQHYDEQIGSLAAQFPREKPWSVSDDE